jgi:hypothetical protein
MAASWGAPSRDDLTSRRFDSLLRGCPRVQFSQPLQPGDQLNELSCRPSGRPLNLRHRCFVDPTERGPRNLPHLSWRQPRQQVMHPHPAGQKQYLWGGANQCSRVNHLQKNPSCVKDNHLIPVMPDTLCDERMWFWLTRLIHLTRRTSNNLRKWKGQAFRYVVSSNPSFACSTQKIEH